MSSHREAPAISQDPVADNTDLYAFVSPDRPNSVTIIANYLPLQAPAGGPNFFEFGDDVLYEISIDNDGDAQPEIVYQFTFQTAVRNPDTFLYNTGPINSLNDTDWNVRQFYSVTKTVNGQTTTIGSRLPCPPCNIGPTSTPNYATLAQAAVRPLSSGETVFAGQRADGFYVDLGSIFDLADLRPFQNLFFNPMSAVPCVNGLNGYNVNSIAIRVPKTMLTSDGSNPTDPASATSVIGVWAAAYRRRSRVLNGPSGEQEYGSYVQVSRLGNPLINEAIIPRGRKDYWNAVTPYSDAAFDQYYQHPEVANLLPGLYPGVFPNLAGLTASRDDLVAILLTGIPTGIVGGFQNYTGPTHADQLRLNMAIAPATTPNPMGILGGDLAGFPNGRRVTDDVVSIEVQALAGATYPLVNPSYTPDGAASLVNQGLSPSSVRAGYLSRFPYLGVPYDGYSNPSS